MMYRSFFIIGLWMPLAAIAEWTPPTKPDPEAILDEARADIQTGRSEDALAKLVWFHNHALEYDRSLYGVRLVSGLDNWYKLAKVYPPALIKLKETRDAAAKQVTEHNDMDKVPQLFHDFLSINEQLGNEDQTVELFMRLDKEAPEVARKVYDITQSTLVRAKKFALCGKYLEPEKAYAHWVELYGVEAKLADGQGSARVQETVEFAEKRFLERAATIIALLALNERKPEAEKFADSARSKSKDSERDAVIDAALQGKVPNQVFE